MCLNLVKTKDTFEEHIEIAQEDMVVYKVMSYKSKYLGLWKRFYSYYQAFVYKPNKVYKVDKFGYDIFRANNMYYEIGKGFHAYLTHEDAYCFIKHYGVLTVNIIECIIPKGTEYLKNSYEIVSKSIKCVKVVK